MWTGIFLIILGLLAIPNLFLAKHHNRRILLEKLNPIISIIGVFYMIWGIWSIVSSFLAIGSIVDNPISWIFLLLISLITFGLGFILAFPFLKKYVFMNRKEEKEGKNVYDRFRSVQSILGVLAILIGLIFMCFHIFWS